MLAPGGVFVASTFLTAVAPLGQLIGDDLVRPFQQVGSGWGGPNGCHLAFITETVCMPMAVWEGTTRVTRGVYSSQCIFPVVGNHWRLLHA